MAEGGMPLLAPPAPATDAPRASHQFATLLSLIFPDDDNIVARISRRSIWS